MVAAAETFPVAVSSTDHCELFVLDEQTGDVCSFDLASAADLPGAIHLTAGLQRQVLDGSSVARLVVSDSLLLTASDDGAVSLVDLFSSRVCSRLRAEPGYAVVDMAAHPVHDSIIAAVYQHSASSEWRVCVWDACRSSDQLLLYVSDEDGSETFHNIAWFHDTTDLLLVCTSSGARLLRVGGDKGAELVEGVTGDVLRGPVTGRLRPERFACWLEKEGEWTLQIRDRRRMGAVLNRVEAGGAPCQLAWHPRRAEELWMARQGEGGRLVCCTLLISDDCDTPRGVVDPLLPSDVPEWQRERERERPRLRHALRVGGGGAASRRTRRERQSDGVAVAHTPRPLDEIPSMEKAQLIREMENDTRIDNYECSLSSIDGFVFAVSCPYGDAELEERVMVWRRSGRDGEKTAVEVEYVRPLASPELPPWTERVPSVGVEVDLRTRAHMVQRARAGVGMTKGGFDWRREMLLSSLPVLREAHRADGLFWAWLDVAFRANHVIDVNECVHTARRPGAKKESLRQSTASAPLPMLYTVKGLPGLLQLALRADSKQVIVIDPLLANPGTPRFSSPERDAMLRCIGLAPPTDRAAVEAMFRTIADPLHQHGELFHATFLAILYTKGHHLMHFSRRLPIVMGVDPDLHSTGYILHADDVHKTMERFFILRDLQLKSDSEFQAKLTEWHECLDDYPTRPAVLYSSLVHCLLRLLTSIIQPERTDKLVTEVLNEHSVPLPLRLCLAILWLPDEKLRRLMHVHSIASSGRLHRLVYVGLGRCEDSIQAIMDYVHATGDVQTGTVLLLCGGCIGGRAEPMVRGSRPSLPHLAEIFPSTITTRFTMKQLELQALQCLSTYQQVLHSAREWAASALLRGAIGGREPESVVRAGLSCQFCYVSHEEALRNQAAIELNDITPPKRQGRPAAEEPAPEELDGGRRVRAQACPMCRKPYPTCVHCGLFFGTALDENDDGRVSDAFSVCLMCNHGGHTSHQLKWFARSKVCAVWGCACECTRFDHSTAPVAVEVRPAARARTNTQQHSVDSLPVHYAPVIQEPVLREEVV